MLTLLIALTAALAIGSVAEIHAQSSDYRTSIDTGYGALASRVVDASNQTGAELATLMDGAATLPNGPIPCTARNEIQQGLDQAVNSTSAQASQAAGLVPPYPTGSVSTQFTSVMSERSQATSDLRTTIDGLLGMEPLPVAGAPSNPSPKESAALLPIPKAAAAMAAAGVLLQRADGNYRQLVAYVRRQHIPVHLPASVWVPSPAASAPLSPVRLGASATALSSSAALVPYHQMVITAAGLNPPAVPPAAQSIATSGGPGIVGDSCTDPVSATPGPTPAVLPPDQDHPGLDDGDQLRDGARVRGGGEPDPHAGRRLPGRQPPPPGQRGGTTRTKVTLRSGSSVALTMPPLAVAGGYRLRAHPGRGHSPPGQSGRSHPAVPDPDHRLTGRQLRPVAAATGGGPCRYQGSRRRRSDRPPVGQWRGVSI